MVSYKVTDEQGRTAVYTNAQLLQLLFSASLDKNKLDERKWTVELVGILGDVLTSTKTILNNTFIDLLLIAFNVGFYYSRFLYLNKVEIIDDNSNHVDI